LILKKHIPAAPLDRFIESILYLEGNNIGTGLPKIAMSLIFNLEDNFKLFTDDSFTQFIDYKRHWVAGLQTLPSRVESYGTSKMLVVQFKPIGACCFLQEPLHCYTNQYIKLDQVYHKEADETWEQLKEAVSLQQQYSIVEKFLFNRLIKQKEPNKKLIATIELLFSKENTFSVDEICKQLNISRKHLNHLSKEYAGVSTKTLSSLNRFQNILKAISRAPAEKLTALGYEMEYFDQAHFSNDFKRFSGLSPSEYTLLVKDSASMKIVPHFIPYRQW
jgi:AraC-like DNA-binding protein